MSFRARTDGFVFVLTTIVLLLMGFVLFALLSAAASRPSSTILNVALIASAILVVSIVIFAYVYTPKAFHIEAKLLRIERPANDVVIPVASISDVTLLDEFLGISLKAPPGGNSGLFGIYGTFWKRSLGKYQMYGRSATQGVLLKTSDGNIVVTPERREAFVTALRETMSRLDRESTEG